jgi:hypothetical protein
MFLQTIYVSALKAEKKCQHHQPLSKCKSKILDATLYPPGWSFFLKMEYSKLQ